MKLNNKNRVRIEKICRYLGYINPLIPKGRKKIFIYNSTQTYQNSYAMFNYLIEHGYNQKYKIYYYMPEVQNYVANIDNVELNYSLVGSLFHYLTAKYVFFDTGNIRIRPSKRQVVMNLWHGVPFKSIGFMSKTVEKDLPKDLMNAFTKIIVPSKNLKDIYLQSFLLEEDQIFYGGQPRNDLLKKDVEPFKLLNIDVKKYKKTIMWMTTYRVSKDDRLCHTSNIEWSSTNLPLLINQEIISEIDKELAKHNILLIIKHHTTGKLPNSEIYDTRNIKILEEDEFLNKGLQLYDILGKCDALITDYSSVFIDYLLVDNPIAFVVDDIEDYDMNNGFTMQNPLQYMPGRHLRQLEDLREFFVDIISGKDEYNEKRRKISQYFNAYNQEDNCKYILKSMKIE